MFGYLPPGHALFGDDGQAATSNNPTTIAVTSAMVTFGGQAVKANQQLQVTAAVLAASPQPITLNARTNLNVVAGALPLQGQSVNPATATRIEVTAAAITLSPTTNTVNAKTRLVNLPASISLSELDVDAQQRISVAPPALNFITTTVDPTIPLPPFNSAPYTGRSRRKQKPAK